MGEAEQIARLLELLLALLIGVIVGGFLQALRCGISPPERPTPLMADTLEFKTAKKRRTPIKFTLDGEEFTFTPPKTARLTLSTMLGEDDENDLKILFDWIGEGLPEKQTQRLVERLKAPPEEDDFDQDDLVEIVNGLAEKIAGRPTT